MDFVGRRDELRLLHEQLGRVERDGRGRFVLVRGRRQVGKSRLVEEFLGTTEVPSVFFAATRGRDARWELDAFARAVAGSDLAAATAFTGARFERWDAALAAIASAARGPEVVVLDELPYLFEQAAEAEGALQTAWDRSLSRAPVLLVAIGSDLATMEALTTYGRPLYGRIGRETALDPLSPADVATLTGLDDPVLALDAYLLTGGFPSLTSEWVNGEAPSAHLRREVADPMSPLLVVGERMVTAELPAATNAREVLAAIGSGLVSFTRLADRTGLHRSSLELGLRDLSRKRVVERRRPLSARASRESRYVIADSYLRFWLRFLDQGREEAQRGRGRQLAERVEAQWSTYRGSAIEPVVRRALERRLPDERVPGARYVGGYWTRSGSVEVDLVGGAAADAPTAVRALGSVRWRSRRPFGRDDLAQLAAARELVPGAAQARLIGVSASGFTTGDLDLAWTPKDVLDAWRS